VRVNREPILVLAGLALVGYLLLLAVQPYSVTSPWTRWDEPGRRYFAAAVRLDSAALGRLSASPGAVSWGLREGHRQRNTLAVWARSARAWVGFRRGDTTDVWYGRATDDCSSHLTFVSERSPRVVEASASCNYRLHWPTDPKVIDVSPPAPAPADTLGPRDLTLRHRSMGAVKPVPARAPAPEMYAQSR